MSEPLTQTKQQLHHHQNQRSTHQNIKKRLLQFISDPNPIQKTQKLKPSSIFPLKQLPKFKFTNQCIVPTTSVESTTIPPNQILMLESTSLKQLFQQPTYISTPRASTKNNNQFCCIDANFQQSQSHPLSKNPQTIAQYLQQDNLIKKSSFNLQLKSEKLLSFSSVKNKIFHQEIKPINSLILSKKQQIYFQSRFESGNLCFATPVFGQQHSYYLLCSRDINTTKCTQWFFFKTINAKIGKVTFHILNFVKPYSIFQNGMKICFASKTNGYQWVRGCDDIKYRKTNLPITKNYQNSYYYALSFSYTYTSPQDNVYFAYCYPYTYTMLQQFLFHKADSNPYIKRRKITSTIGGNNIDLLTITNFKNKSKKRIILITCRVHPGQTPSSFVCEGIMKYLMGNTEQANILRDHFIFKIIPMLNPDGVINGSYRCNLAGQDLNRVWDKATKHQNPQIYQVCKVINQLNSKQKIFLFMDLHSHSKRKGIFVYGCENKNQPYLCRQIPFLFWKNIPNFNYHQCNFLLKIDREGTSRLYVYKNFDINYSYTFQHSFCGPLKQKIHFIAKDYCKLGIQYLLTLYKYYGNYNQCFKQQQSELFKQLYTKQFIAIQPSDCILSSSDQQSPNKLPYQKKSINKSDRTIEKLSLKKQFPLRVSQKIITKQNKILINTNRKSISQFNTIQQSSTKHQPNSVYLQTTKRIPIVQLSLLQKKQHLSKHFYKFPFYQPFHHRKCFSSFSHYTLNQLKQKNLSLKFNIIHNNQKNYQHKNDESLQIIQGFNCLYLPSLTKGSYQKYHRRSPNSKDGLQINNNFIDNVKILKQQIKPVKIQKIYKKQQFKYQ